MKKYKNTIDWINEAKKIHGQLYSYEKTVYTNSEDKVCVTCPVHGDFFIRASRHIAEKKGCPKCAKDLSSKKRKMTYEQFIEKARQIHGDKYDYSKTNYINSKTKVCIICPEHGEFWQIPSQHIQGVGCKKCAMEILNGKKRGNINEFILKARQIHGWKYDYSKVEYKNSRTKVCIICPEHGEFWQIPHHHLCGNGCLECGRHKKSIEKRRSVEKFIKEAKQIHGDKYDYSKVKDNSQKDKVCIICPEHGEFWQSAVGHINNRQGCPKCNGSGFIYTNEYFIEKCKQIHGDKYDYSKTEYDSPNTKVCIICPDHGEFWQRASSHLEGYGCKKCATELLKNKLSFNNEIIINKFKNAHGNRYDYSKVKYEGINKKVCIICPEHGEFWQTPNAHHLLHQGCPNCKKSMMEEYIGLILDRNNIKYIFEKKFDWLKYNGDLRLDYFLPDYNTAIECQGGQHFKPVKYFGGEDGFKNTIARDRKKYELCEEHNIKLVYIVNNNYKNNNFLKENYADKDVIFFKNCENKLLQFFNAE